ncbi:Ribonuclease H-like domain [Phytophthora cactorum]|nr:Ribonuclease H-like domain [Phytophthora cactorum]
MVEVSISYSLMLEVPARKTPVLDLRIREYRPLTGRHVFVLFFDGGSRGNPGPSGSGAVVIQISPGHEGHNIRWISSISFTSATTTNNVAENLGLLIGLRAYHRHNWIPLQAIGDSCIIIQHQRARTPSKAKHLVGGSGRAGGSPTFSMSPNATTIGENSPKWRIHWLTWPWIRVGAYNARLREWMGPQHSGNKFSYTLPEMLDSGMSGPQMGVPRNSGPSYINRYRGLQRVTYEGRAFG